jgi:hypothetical protein
VKTRRPEEVQSVFSSTDTLTFVWSRHCATNRKVAGSIPDEVIGFFSWPNPSSHTMALGLTQPLTEVGIRNLPRSKGWPRVMLTTLPTSVSRLSTKCGNRYVSQTSGPPRPVTRVALPLPYNLSVIEPNLWNFHRSFYTLVKFVSCRWKRWIE